MFRVVIPARYGSTRLPGKVLVDLAGKPMLRWVHERALASRAREVWIATDDARIAEAMRPYGASVAMTSLHHASGTDRIAEVARKQRWAEDDIVVNVQGDEPMLPPALIDQVAGILESNARADIATLASPISSLQAFLDPNVVKVVADEQGRALYFSRAPIPWNRDGAPEGLQSQQSFAGARRHIGIYAYRVRALNRLASLPASPLETAERLEQLRALENGLEICVADAAQPPGQDVNTPEDLQKILTHLRG